MSKTSYDVPALRKAIRLIEFLCDSQEPRRMSEMVALLQMNSNIIFRMLRTLVEEGWVVQVDEFHYAMSLRPFHHTSKPIRRMNLYTAAKRPLEQLWQQTGESLYLGVTDGLRTLFLEHLDARGDIRITAKPGGRFPMHCAAPGKVLMAFGDPKLPAQVAAEGLTAQTRHTITTLDRLLEELALIRKQGYGMDLEEFAEGLICLAAPIFDAHEHLAGTIGVSVLTLYYSTAQLRDQFAPPIRAAAREISLALGCPEDYFNQHPSL